MEIKKEKKLRCLLVEPKKLPEVIEIDNTTEAIEYYLGRNIGKFNLDEDDAVLLFDEEAKLRGDPLNRFLDYELILGDFLIVREEYKEDNYVSLTDEGIKYYNEMFGKSSIIEKVVFASNDKEYER